MNAPDDLLRDAADVWCPSYPRRVGTPTPGRWRQVTAYDQAELLHHIKESGDRDTPGYVSTYSFPEGHTSDEGENIPQIDTLMFDMDYDGGDDGSPSAWAKDMSALLVRTRMVAQELIRMGKAKYWRASLSGHKGTHFYIDFDPIPVENGNEAQFRAGLRAYTNELIEVLQAVTGLESLSDYFDVSSGKDLARMTRLPNTIHEKASERFGEPRYCVPVSIEELASITPGEYIRLTKEPRPVPDMCRRIPNPKSHEVIARRVREAPGGQTYTSGSGGGFYQTGPVLKQYENEKANPDVTPELLRLHLSNRPCIGAYRENPDAFNKGQQSHIMEMNVIAAMKNLNAPVESMHSYFSEMPGYSEKQTDDRIAAVIHAEMASDDDEAYRGLNCETIIQDAPAFCLGEQSGSGNCRVWDREFSEQPAR